MQQLEEDFIKIVITADVHSVQFRRHFNKMSMKRVGRYTRAATQQSQQDLLTYLLLDELY